jgi:predicted CXXCH cytochrome family protein
MSCDFIRHSVSALILLTACAQLPAVQLQQSVVKAGCLKYQDPKSIEPLKKFKEPALEKGCIACHLDCNQLPADFQPESSEYYLKAKEPALCLECHSDPKKDLAPAHDNQPLGNSKCSGCHDPHSSNIPKLLREFSHGPYKARLCSACHPAPVNGEVQLTAPVNGKVQFTATDVDLLCYECHTQFKEEMEGTKSRHKLLLQSKRSCLECHDAHAANQENVLKKPVRNLCVDCHVAKPEKTAPAKQLPKPSGIPSLEYVKAAKPSEFDTMKYVDLSLKHVHAPVGESCLICHDAHASEFPMELRAPMRDLCMGCHGENSEKIVQSSQPFPLFNGLVSLPPKTFEKLRHFELSGKYIHEPVNISCAYCHDAHASDYPMALYAPIQDICMGCHGSNASSIINSERPVSLFGGKVVLPPKAFEKLTHFDIHDRRFGHPTANHPFFVPATADKPELNCLTCHNAHSASSDPQRLETDKDSLCARCHKM